MTQAVDPLLGVQVGSYRIERVIGQGGMGRVYAAVQPTLGSRVAMKVLSEELAREPELAERLFAEARAANLIAHENIVNVLDLVTLPDGRPVIVMELLEGKPLRELVRAGPTPMGAVVHVMIEVLSALAAAHAVGIVHRDLKPDNILITNGGRAKVLDFGIAKLARSEPGMMMGPRTRTGIVLGTPEYMAPEQITGGQVDARTDIYAAGVVLFEALTGKRPFGGPSDFEVMRAHVDLPPPSPRELRPEIPVEIEHVILCALAKDPERRFANATAMANALQAASAAFAAPEWRSFTPHGRAYMRPTPLTPRPQRTSKPPPIAGASGALPTANDRPSARQLDATRAETPRRSRPSDELDAQTRRETPSARKIDVRSPRRSRSWIIAVVAAGTGTVIGLVLAGSRGAGSTTTARSEDPGSGTAIAAPADAGVPVVAVADAQPPAPVDAMVVAQVVVDAAPVTTTTPAPEKRPPMDTPHDGPTDRRTGTQGTKRPDPTPRRDHDMIDPFTAPVDEDRSGGADDDGPPVRKPHQVIEDKLDPASYDPIRYIATARALARRLEDDAELTEVYLQPVNKDGRVTMQRDSGGQVRHYTFRSPKRGAPKRPPRAHECEVLVEVNTWGDVTVTRRLDDSCTARPVGAPRCSLAQVWAKAIAQGASDQFDASIQWTARGWELRGIVLSGEDRMKTDFTFRDDCR